MADFEVGDIIRIAGVLTYDSTETLVNTYHVELTAGGPLAWADFFPRVQDYMDDIMQLIDTELSTLVVTDVLQVANVTQDTVFGAVGWGDFAQGGAAGEPTAAGVACFGFIRTRLPRVQIRKYYGVFPQSSMVDGIWDAGVTAAVQDAMDTHMADTLAGSGVYLQGVAYNRTLGTHTTGVSAAVRDEPAYQRRRKRGVGS